MTLSSPAGAGTGIVNINSGGKIFVGNQAGDFGPFDVTVNATSPLSSSGILTIANGSTLSSVLGGSIGVFVGNSGRVIVKDAGSVWNSAGAIQIGQSASGELTIQSGGRVNSTAGTIFVGEFNAGNGSLNVLSGGRLDTEFKVVIGVEATTTGVATVSGTNSILNVGTTLEVGLSGTGTVNINTAGKVTAANAVLGNAASGVGTINLAGAGSLLDIEGDLTVGKLGRGTVNDGNGVLVGDAATLVGELDVSDSNLAGDAGGNVVLNNQSTWTMNNVVHLATSANTYGRLAVNSGSSFTTNSALECGNFGSGTLDVTAGGKVNLINANNGAALNIGFNAGGRGTVTVDGAGSLLDVNNSVTVGNVVGNAVSTLTVRNGGLLLVGDLANPTPAPPATTRVLVVDATLDGSSGGIIDVRPGSLLDATGGNVVLANAASSFGRINLKGANARLLAANVAVGGPGRGQLDIAGGTLTATGTVTVAGSGSQINLTGGELVAANLNTTAAPAGFSFTGGKLSVRSVSGTIFQEGGVFAPNGSGSALAADVVITGNYNIIGGSVEIELGQAADDNIVATGQLNLSGNLNLLNLGFVPTLGQSFEIMRGVSRAGQFATVAGVSHSSNRSFAVTYTSTQVVYTVALPGDASLSNGVEFNDLVALAQSYNLDGKSWVSGDFNGTGTVDFNDLVILAQNYGRTSVEDLSSLPADFAADWILAQSLVPEPSIAVAASAVVMASAARRRRARLDPRA